MVRNTPRGTPARVLILFGLLTGIVAVSAFRDARDPGAGRISWPTALGDNGFHRPGTTPPVLEAGGHRFRLVEDPSGWLQRADDRMWRVPLTVPQPRLYSPENTPVPDALPPLYLKTGPGEFLRVELRDEAGN